MKRLLLGLAVVLLVPLSLFAQDATTNTRTKKADQKKKSAFQKLNGEFQKAYSNLVSDFRKAKTDKKKNEIRKRIPKLNQEFAPKFLKAAEADPKSDVGFQCLSWVLQRQRSGKQFDRALDLIAKHHVTHKNIVRVTSGLLRSQSKKASKFLEAVMKKHPDKTVKGQISITLAAKLKRTAEMEGDLKLYAKAEKAYENAAAEYGSVRVPRSGTVAKASADALKDMRGPRALGKIAPEIEAEDLDGETFKLSEYRGKVVLIDFWGNW